MMDRLTDSDFDAIEVTLKCLANSTYQEVLKKKQVKDTLQEEYILYSKQVNEMLQDILNDIYETDIIKEAYMDMVHVMIEHIKVQERIQSLPKRSKSYTFGILPIIMEETDIKQCIVDSDSFDKKNVYPLFHMNKKE